MEGLSNVTADELVQYARAIWGVVVEKRGHEWPDMSSSDFHLICQWMEARVPLRVVLRGLEDCKGTGKTLRYYEGAVREAIAYHHKAFA